MPHVPDTVPGKRVAGAGARTEGRGQPSNIRGGSRMQESCPYGSVRGAPSNGRPYRNRKIGSGFEASAGLGPIGRRRGGITRAVVGLGNAIELFRRLEEPPLKPDEGTHAVGGGEAIAELEVRIQMGWTPSATTEPGSDRIGGTALSFNERSP